MHGDLTDDNILIDDNKKVVILDFADSLCAPEIYEDMTIICDAFSFDRHFLEGYLGKVDVEYIVERSIKALLCH